jgi:hypothetical protein
METGSGDQGKDSGRNRKDMEKIITWLDEE